MIATKDSARTGTRVSRRPLATPIAAAILAAGAIAVTVAVLAAVTAGTSLASANVPSTPRGASGPYSQVQYDIQLPTLPLGGTAH